MLEHVRCQHPVGQGFFHSGVVKIGRAQVHYIYDCGSDDQEALDSEIQAYSAERAPDNRVGALYVSHLHSDHVNGLDKLLGAVEVHTVVLPYLSPMERLILLGEAADRGPVSGTYVYFVSSPARWFGDRGVRRVVFVRGDEGIVGHVDLPPNPQLPGGDDILELELTFESGQTDHLLGQYPVPTAIETDVQVFEIRHLVPFLLKAGRKTLNWVFIPFVHPEGALEERFRARVAREFPTLSLDDDRRFPEKVEELTSILRDPKKRDKLGNCYDEIRKDRNLTSLSLYSGPITVHPSACSVRRQLPLCPSGYWSGLCPYRDLLYRVDKRCAWLGTGDAKFTVQRRLNAFFKHFHEVYPFVSTLALPHHGSRHNSDGRLLDGDVPIYLASAGQNSRHGHPHPEVRARIRSKGLQFVLTTEDRGSAFRESFVLRARR